jgi:hypothetical protein
MIRQVFSKGWDLFPTNLPFSQLQVLGSAHTSSPFERQADSKQEKNLEAHTMASTAVIQQGIDNRCTILHQARFLPAPAQKLWHKACKIWWQE